MALSVAELALGRDLNLCSKKSVNSAGNIAACRQQLPPMAHLTKR